VTTIEHVGGTTDYMVTVTDARSREPERRFVVALGRTFRVEPSNPQKMRNRGRVGTVVTYAYEPEHAPTGANGRGEYDGPPGFWKPMSVVLRFADNGRRGRADFDELIEVNA